MLTPSGGLYQLTPYEGMRVSIGSMTAISGTNGSITSAATVRNTYRNKILIARGVSFSMKADHTPEYERWPNASS